MKNIVSRHPVIAEEQIPTGNHKCAQIQTNLRIPTCAEQQTIAALNIISVHCLERCAEIGWATLYWSSPVLTRFMKKTQEIVCMYLLQAKSQKGQRLNLQLEKPQKCRIKWHSISHYIHFLRWAAYIRNSTYWQILASYFFLDRLQKSFLQLLYAEGQWIRLK